MIAAMVLSKILNSHTPIKSYRQPSHDGRRHCFTINYFIPCFLSDYVFPAVLDVDAAGWYIVYADPL